MDEEQKTIAHPEVYVAIGFRDGDRWDRLVGVFPAREEAQRDVERFSDVSADERPETVIVYRCKVGADGEFEDANEYNVSKRTWRTP